MRRGKRKVMQEIHRLNKMLDEITEGQTIPLEECSNPEVAGILSAASASLLWAIGVAPICITPPRRRMMKLSSLVFIMMSPGFRFCRLARKL